MRIVRELVVVAVVACSGASGLADEPFFQGLGDLPGGSYSSGAWGVSADGTVAVGPSNSASGTETFRWENGVMIGLGDLPGGSFFSDARAVSANGAVVVGQSSAAVYLEAFRWTAEGGMVGLGHLFEHPSWSDAWGTSVDGSVVVGASTEYSRTEAFRWENGVMVGLGDLPGGDFYSWAMGVTPDASVIVGQATAAWTQEAVRWDDGVITSLGCLPGGGYAGAMAVTPDGSVIVGASNSTDSGYYGFEALRWTEAGGMVGLGDLAGGDFLSCAIDVSADGSIIVGYGYTAAGSTAFIWDADNGMRNLRDVLVNEYGLDLTGWILSWANGISADGTTIVGDGTNPDGNDEAWIAHLGSPSPCPGDLDGDGDVDLSDLAQLLANYGTTSGATYEDGDLDADGDVDLTDLAALLAEYGTICP